MFAEFRKWCHARGKVTTVLGMGFFKYPWPKLKAEGPSAGSAVTRGYQARFAALIASWACSHASPNSSMASAYSSWPHS